jgi:hypothetical protein
MAQRSKRARDPLGPLVDAPNRAPGSSFSRDSSGAASATTATPPAPRDPHAERQAAILEGLEAVKAVDDSLTIAELCALFKKFKTQKYVLVVLGEKIEKIVGRDFEAVLKDWQEENGEKLKKLPVKVKALRHAAEGSWPDDLPPELHVLEKLEEYLEDPCGNLEPPFLRTASLMDAELCDALGEEVLSSNPEKPLSDEVIARLVAVMSQYGGAQSGRGMSWVHAVCNENRHHPLVGMHLDPPAVVIHPVPAGLAAFVGALPTNGGFFAAGVPVIGVPAPSVAAAPAIPDIIVCHSRKDAEGLALALREFVGGLGTGAAATNIMWFTTRAGFTFNF